MFLTSLDNQNLLRALEILVVALIWLFFFRVIRAVWVQVRPPPARGAAAQGPRRPQDHARRRIAGVGPASSTSRSSSPKRATDRPSRWAKK